LGSFERAPLDLQQPLLILPLQGKDEALGHQHLQGKAGRRATRSHRIDNARCDKRIYPLYVDTAVRRWQAFTRQRAVRASDDSAHRTLASAGLRLLTNCFGNHALLGFVFAFRHRGEPTEQEQSEHEPDYETDYETGYEVNHRTCVRRTATAALPVEILRISA
jgi:hypothetical protein